MARPWSRLAAVALAAGLVLASAGKGHAADAAASALLPDDLRQKGVLTAAMPLDFEPFNYLDDKDRQTGLDVEIFKAVALTLGLKPEIERQGFASIIPAVKGGRVDVGMSAMAILKPRLATVSFVRYGLLSSGLVVRKGNPTHVRTDQGCGHSIALEKGTNSLFVWQDIAKTCEAEGKPRIDIMVFDGRGPQLLAVETSRAEAAGFGYASAMIASQHSNGKLETAPGGPVPGATTESGIAFAKDSPKLGEAIEAALKVMAANGTYDRIYAKWGLSGDRAAPAIFQ